MGILLDALRPMWLPGIIDAVTPIGLSFSDWIKRQNFYFIEVNSDKSFSIQSAEHEQISTLFAAISSRTMAACFESFVSIREVESLPRSLAWLSIKLYYSAFFAAHGYMRLCGSGCINVDALDATRLYENADAYGLTSNVRRFVTGQYYIKTMPNSGVISFNAVDSNGSHEALWKVFDLFLEDIVSFANDKLTIRDQRQIVLETVASLRAILQHRGCNGGNWLSQIRNSIQYRQTYGVWFPYSMEKSASTRMTADAKGRFLDEPELIDLASLAKRPVQEFEAFFGCSTFLASLARVNVIDLSARSVNPKSAFRLGPGAFLKLGKLV